MNKYSVGIIGCGRIAGYLEDDPLRGKPCTHVGAYQRLNTCEVIACCARTEDNVTRFAKRFSIPRTYRDYQEMLDNEDLDIVSICTFAPTHAEITCYAAKRGVRAIFCEKAMATTLKEADAMIRTCRKEDIVLSVNHTRRWDSAYIHAKEMIKNGALGKLQSINGTFSGNMIHTGIHMFDALVYLGGNVASVSGNLVEEAILFESSGYRYAPVSYPVEDQDGCATLFFKNGAIGQVLGLGKSYFIFEIDIQGSEGRLKLGNGLFEYWKMKESTHYTDFFELEKQEYVFPRLHTSIIQFAVEDIIAAIEEGKDTRCSGESALQAFEITLAVYESHRKKGKCVKLPLRNRKRRVLSR